MENATVHPLFSYGTLQQPEVQLATYGRLLEGERDVLRGYRLENLPSRDPAAILISGTALHKVARPGGPMDLIRGMVFTLTPDELASTDAYEGDDYRRVAVTLESGATAYVYVAPDSRDF